MLEYKVVKIPKKNGTFRTIYVPDRKYKKELRNLLMSNFFQKTMPHHITGFVHQHNVSTNAQQHIGYNYTLSMDMTDFFDTVDKTHFNKYSEGNRKHIDRCFVGGRLRQGLPTSPYLSNLAGLTMDESILRYIRKNFKKEQKEVVYTRYADDLAFSFNEYSIYEKLRDNIPRIVANCRFKINPKKTHLQDARFGYRRICGVNVGKEGIKTPRKLDRKIRAAQFLFAQTGCEEFALSEDGLREFRKLKAPNYQNKEDLRQAKRLLHHFHMDHIGKRLRKMPKAIPNQKIGNVVITDDPVYFCGMSVFTNGWNSCMNLAGSRTWRKGVWMWYNLEGCSLAYLPSTNHKTVGGITRVAMQERALVYETSDHCRYIGRNYPRVGEITQTLMDAGFKKANMGSGKRVKGRVRQLSCQPFKDNTKTVKITDNGKKYYKFILI